MASLTKRPNGHKWIQYSIDGARHTLRLGKISESAALQVKAHVEELLSAKSGKGKPTHETWLWVERVGDRIHRNLARVGLVMPREVGRSSNCAPSADYAVESRPFRQSNDERPGVVYFLEALGIGKVKIGWTTMPHRRVAELKLMSPVLLRPLAFLPGSRSDEAKLHHRFSEYRAWGEWFLFCDPLKEEIANCGAVLAGDDWEQAASDAMPQLTAREFYELYPEKLKQRRRKS